MVRISDAEYNRCSRVAAKACANVKIELAKRNAMQNPDSIRIKTRNKDVLMQYVSELMSLPQRNNIAVYASRIQNMLLFITSDARLKDTSVAGMVFVDSVFRSKDARTCQKYLVDLMAAERYFQEAYDYDKQHPYKLLADSALEQSRQIVARKYSKAFLNYFDFSSRPRLHSSDESVNRKFESFKQQAFDSRYSLSSEEGNKDIVNKKYQIEYVSRNDFFITKKDPENIVRDRQIPLQSLAITELYNATFAVIPGTGTMRKFVDLRYANRDIELCPMHNLAMKKQRADIESKTMHRFIYDNYTDEIPKNFNTADIERYYFQRELDMYRLMWGENVIVKYENSALIFPDGRRVEFDSSIPPGECLHQVNAAYGALFGYTKEDMPKKSKDDKKAKSSWLENSIRQAYTAEGTAIYRLAMIEARRDGRLTG